MTFIVMHKNTKVVLLVSKLKMVLFLLRMSELIYHIINILKKTLTHLDWFCNKNKCGYTYKK